MQLAVACDRPTTRREGKLDGASIGSEPGRARWIRRPRQADKVTRSCTQKCPRDHARTLRPVRIPGGSATRSLTGWPAGFAWRAADTAADSGTRVPIAPNLRLC